MLRKLIFWEKYGWPGYSNLHPEVEEGICQVLGHMWLESEIYSSSGSNAASSSSVDSSSSTSSKKGRRSDFERQLGEFFKHQIESDTSPVYGEGFQSGHQAVQKYGLKSTLDHIKMTGHFPLWHQAIYVFHIVLLIIRPLSKALGNDDRKHDLLLACVILFPLRLSMLNMYFWVLLLMTTQTYTEKLAYFMVWYSKKTLHPTIDGDFPYLKVVCTEMWQPLQWICNKKIPFHLLSHASITGKKSQVFLSSDPCAMCSLALADYVHGTLLAFPGCEDQSPRCHYWTPTPS